MYRAPRPSIIKSAVFSLLLLFGSAAPSQILTDACANRNVPVVVAVVNSFGPGVSDDYYHETIAALKMAVAPRELLVQKLTQDEFLRAAQNNDFDISIASSGLTAIVNQKYGGTPLLSVINVETPNPDHGSGSALIVRSDDDRIQSPKDLKDKKLAIVSKNAFSGYMIPTVELYRDGYDLEKMADFLIVPRSMQRVFEKVKSGEADVGIVVTCLKEALERDHKIERGEFKVLFPKKHRNFYCESSTDLYPTWIISAKKGLPSGTARKIVQNLLEMKPDPDLHTQWTVSTDNEGLRELFKTLRDRFPEDRNIADLLRAYKWWFLGLLALIAAGIINTLVLGNLVRKRTRETEEAVKKQMQAEVSNAKNLARLESMQKASSVGILSSMVAHELKQPLAAINNYTEGLKRRLRKGVPMSSELLAEIAEEIRSESLRASDIVELVRNYGKQTRRVTGLVDVGELTRHVVEVVGGVRSHNARIECDIEKDCLVKADKLELEIVLINLLKNAFEALEGERDKKILVEVSKSPKYVFIKIRDNGPKLTSGEFNKIGQFGESSKPGGLGFGLSIVRELLEPYAGVMTITPNEDKGLTVSIRLPKADEKEKDELKCTGGQNS